MEDEPLSNVTIFNNTKEAIIHGGDFSVHHHNAIKSESDTDINIKELYNHIFTAALHDSPERTLEHRQSDLKKILHDWSLRFPTTISKSILESPSPSISSFDRLSIDDALYDIIKWLHDPLTSHLIAWIHGEASSESQVLLLACAIANIFHQHGLLSASFFFSSATDNSSVVPTIAYQLSQNISQARDPIAQAVGQYLAVFVSGCHHQVEQLIVNPLRNAAESCKDSVEAPSVILIYGLENYNKDDDFQATFLESLSHAIKSLETTSFSQRLLVLGRYTSQLGECFSNLGLLSKVIQRPIQLHSWLEKQNEICRKEKEIERRYEDIAMKEGSINDRAKTLRKELKLQEAQVEQMEEKVKQRGQKLENLERALRSQEEDIASREQKLKKRNETMEEAARRWEEAKRILEKCATEREDAVRNREENVKKREDDLQRRQEEIDQRALFTLKASTVRDATTALDSMYIVKCLLQDDYDPRVKRERFSALYGEILSRCHAIHDAINGRIQALLQPEAEAVARLEKILLSHQFSVPGEQRWIPDHISDVVEGIQFITSFVEERKRLLQVLDDLVPDKFKGLTVSFNPDHEACLVRDEAIALKRLLDFFCAGFGCWKLTDSDIINGRQQAQQPIADIERAINSMSLILLKQPPRADISEMIIKSLILVAIPYILLSNSRQSAKPLSADIDVKLRDIHVWVTIRSLINEISTSLGISVDIALPKIQTKYKALRDLLLHLPWPTIDTGCVLKELSQLCSHICSLCFARSVALVRILLCLDEELGPNAPAKRAKLKQIMLQVTDILERVQRPRISNINVFVFSNQYQIFEEEIQELFDDLGKFNSSIGLSTKWATWADEFQRAVAIDAGAVSNLRKDLAARCR